ncbi:type II secretion system protein [Candidatus Uhrbacteria bacterium]|nr:type II secretion system protein [Candidatus Uhrbacteria bacterium]
MSTNCESRANTTNSSDRYIRNIRNSFVDSYTERGARGFTLIELLVVIAIFGIVTTAVVANLKIGEQGSELRLSAQALVSQLREMQTMAQTGKTVKMCAGQGAVGSPGYCEDRQAGGLCENTNIQCDCSCVDQVPPGGYGLRIDRTAVTAFVDINRSHVYEEGEEFTGVDFELPRRIAVSELIPAAPLDIVFTPPAGSVWINGCDSGIAENDCPPAARVTLGHARLPQVRTVTIYRVSGRIESE